MAACPLPALNMGGRWLRIKKMECIIELGWRDTGRIGVFGCSKYSCCPAKDCFAFSDGWSPHYHVHLLRNEEGYRLMSRGRNDATLDKKATRHRPGLRSARRGEANMTQFEEIEVVEESHVHCCMLAAREKGVTKARRLIL